MANKQYFNQSQPGEKTIESRDGSKVIMDSNGNVVLTTALTTEYMDELIVNSFQNNIDSNEYPDNGASYFFVGTNEVNLNNVGNKNQDSINIKSNNVIIPVEKIGVEEIILPPTYEIANEPIETYQPTRREAILPDNEAAYEDSDWLNTNGDSILGSGFEGPNPLLEELLLLEKIKKVDSKYALDDIELYSILTCKSNNAVNSAILMNPTNYFHPTVAGVFPFISKKPSFLSAGKILSIRDLGPLNNASAFLTNSDNVPNNKMPPLTVINQKNGTLAYQVTNGWFHKWSPLFNAMLKKIVPCPFDNVFCSMGIGMAFAACNPQQNNIYSNLGGFPKNTSSQLISGGGFKEILIFTPTVDYDSKGYLTDAGLKKIDKIRNWKGGVYSWTHSDGKGHIGMILGAEILQEPISKKYRCWLYTLEFNTKIGGPNDPKIIDNPEEFVRQNIAKTGINYYMRTELNRDPKYKLRKTIDGIVDDQWLETAAADGSERTGGKLSFRQRLFCAKGTDKAITKYTLGNTESFSGGSWAPNGLTQANEYVSIGNWKNNKQIFEV